MGKILSRILGRGQHLTVANPEDVDCEHDWEVTNMKQCKRCGLIDKDSFWAELNRLYDEKFPPTPEVGEKSDD